ncbi:MaoC/PaaZ C-terminal domain-containing protein [Cellulomonas edaphi]|uniref:MaoC/PaaZ C-terminal domain-containing protein n=1 Tax=Cellulomonas edaphi TaxID=3053468 RepID=A0ABT7S260_9CELL|nr:MaoC/PaaZ C-terminal domain-containing protein [Cellulomons edaphi]MDM7829709.1 MaoC/PaaZ C-terminal domain-containing protein [Cellulomons edaphi]
MTDRLVELGGVPALGSVYARTVLSSGRLGVQRRLGRAPAPAAGGGAVLHVGGVRVDATRLTDYQHLVGEPASDVLPAGFVHAITFPVAMALMSSADFPLPPLGMVHLSNHVTQSRGVRVGDELDVRAWARDVRPHRSGTQVDLVAQVRVDGDVVWTGVSTYLAKGVTAREQPGGATDDEREPFVAPVPTGRWQLAANTGRRYAAVSGDRNPIHLSALAAKAFGFPRAIAHGMYTAARALADVGAARGEAYVWTVEFAKPVLLPSSPSVRVAPDGDGFAYTAWRPGSSGPHLTGRVDPLR